MIDFPQITVQEYLDSIKPYQVELIAPNLVTGTDDSILAAAKAWLSADGPSFTIAFGGNRDPKPFFDAFMDELTAFVCGTNKAYASERAQLASQMKTGTRGTTLVKTAATYIAGILAAKLGVTAVLLFPAVGLLLILVGKMGVRAWCAHRGCPLT